MNQNETQENRMKAAIKWGETTVRSQQLYPKLLEARRFMNKFDDDMDSSHPYSGEIFHWTLTTKMLSAVTPPQRFKIV
jgi:hypothetical protein